MLVNEIFGWRMVGSASFYGYCVGRSNTHEFIAIILREMTHVSSCSLISIELCNSKSVVESNN